MNAEAKFNIFSTITFCLTYSMSINSYFIKNLLWPSETPCSIYLLCSPLSYGLIFSSSSSLFWMPLIMYLQPEQISRALWWKKTTNPKSYVTVQHHLFVFSFFVLFFLSFVFLGPHPRHMEVPRLVGGRIRAVAAGLHPQPQPTLDLSCICDLRQSS